ncbi:Vanillyl-alcohol oxidase [Venturia nashicola]|uniref:Vanillyl-alcohol oxidase n=1 Tax=Venturia nashicola TaxID=86259 RepID=A0A4Z1PD56_9PEZI|nr:Vanillyl-alcohol oxidase [Venturia nashicola]
MAPPKPTELLSTNVHTVKERARRSKKRGFDLQVMRSQRALNQAKSEARQKLKKSDGWNLLSDTEQRSQIAQAEQAVNDKRMSNGTHPSLLKPDPLALFDFGDQDEDMNDRAEESSSQESSEEEEMDIDITPQAQGSNVAMLFDESYDQRYAEFYLVVFTQARRSWQAIGKGLANLMNGGLNSVEGTHNIYKLLSEEDLESLASSFYNEDGEEQPPVCPADQLPSISPLQFFSMEQVTLIRNLLAHRHDFDERLPGPTRWWDAHPMDEIKLKENLPDRELAMEAWELMFGKKVEARERFGRIRDMDEVNLVMKPLALQATDSLGHALDMDEKIQELQAAAEKLADEVDGSEDEDERTFQLDVESNGEEDEEEEEEEEEEEDDWIVDNVHVEDLSE